MRRFIMQLTWWPGLSLTDAVQAGLWPWERGRRVVGGNKSFSQSSKNFSQSSKSFNSKGSFKNFSSRSTARSSAESDFAGPSCYCSRYGCNCYCSITCWYVWYQPTAVHPYCVLRHFGDAGRRRHARVTTTDDRDDCVAATRLRCHLRSSAWPRPKYAVARRPDS